MIERTSKVHELRILLVEDRIHQGRAASRAAHQLETELTAHRATVLQADGLKDGRGQFLSDAGLHALMIPWILGGDAAEENNEAPELLRLVRSRNEKIPLFLLADRAESAILPEEALALISEMVWLPEDSAAFVGGRILTAARHYARSLLGPMASALVDFDLVHEYSWHTPGHAGGTAFQKSLFGPSSGWKPPRLPPEWLKIRRRTSPLPPSEGSGSRQ